MQSRGPLDLGKERQVIKLAPTGAGTKTVQFPIDSESVLISLFVAGTSGDVNVSVTTEGAAGEEVNVITFPTISAPTTELLLRKAASVLTRIKVTVTYTDACDFEIRARGVRAQAASFEIASATNFRATQVNITTAPVALIPSALTDRSGVLIMNNNVGGSEVLYIGGLITEATTAVGTPIRPGGNFTVDVAAGVTIFAVADTGTIDVRLSETGT